MIVELITYLVHRSKQNYNKAQIISSTLFGASMELGIIPFLLIVCSKQLDKLFSTQMLLSEPLRIVATSLCFLIGIPWFSWAIYVHYVQGRGTPLPLVPTKRLIVKGPYK